MTYVDFEKWGVRRDSIAGSIRALEALGLIEIARHGYAGAAEKRAPNHYRLTYIRAWNAGRTDETGTHEYLKIKTIAEAEEIAQRARKAVNARNSSRAKMNIVTPQFVSNSHHNLRGQKQNARPTNRGVHAPPPNCGALSISREDGGQSKPLAKRAFQSALASERLADPEPLATTCGRIMALIAAEKNAAEQ